MKRKILIVDDEQDLTGALSTRLLSEGYTLESANDAAEGFKKATTAPFDLIILDIMLPGENGLELCRDLRRVGIAAPILVLSARHQTTEKVVAFKIGADEYVTKPFKTAELLARIEALLRRHSACPGRAIHEFGPIRVDAYHAVVMRADQPVHLTAQEYSLLCYLIERPGSSIPRNELLESVWRYDSNTQTRTVDMHIAGLRKKLEENPNHPEFIVTVPGIGYKFEWPRPKMTFGQQA